MSGYSYRRFLAWTVPACIIWASLYVSVAALAAGTYRELADQSALRRLHLRRHHRRLPRCWSSSPRRSSSASSASTSTATKSCPDSPTDRFAPRRTWKTEGMPPTDAVTRAPESAVARATRVPVPCVARAPRPSARTDPDGDALPRLRRSRMGAGPRPGPHRPPGPLDGLGRVRAGARLAQLRFGARGLRAGADHDRRCDPRGRRGPRRRDRHRHPGSARPRDGRRCRCRSRGASRSRRACSSSGPTCASASSRTWTTRSW